MEGDAARAAACAGRLKMLKAVDASGLQGIDEIDSPRGAWSFSEEQGPDQTYYLRKVEQQDGAWTNVVEDELTQPSS